MLDRRLLYFLAVAREGSFSRAADVLHVAQPAVSRQVALLEAEVGVRLLERSSAGVVPTDAGQRLLERGAALEREATALHEELRAFGVGHRGRVALGYSTSLGYGTAPLLIEGLRRRLPAVEVHPRLLPTPELGRAVREGTLDLALVRSAGQVHGVDAEVLRRERLGVLLVADDPLAASDMVDLAALADQTISLHDRAANPGHYDLVVGACRAAGFEPRLLHVGTPFDPSYGALIEGGAVSLAGESSQVGTPAPLVWRPLRDAPRVPISLLRRGTPDDGDGAVVARAVEALRAEAVAQGWTAP
ncbi:HTH-type transcriptional regulator GltC [Baekduia alba]|uniref:LysR family transcriptional regulator n=1 Tax=Baekduia alba TaxID=2997333 RepID=UPI0023405877|nr:LysR family transcriptional regulator [Baekduia alba]WCB92930.1 HTH-type transcriptional regulator GltC [Baekduia alba]